MLTLSHDGSIWFQAAFLPQRKAISQIVRSECTVVWIYVTLRPMFADLPSLALVGRMTEANKNKIQNSLTVACVM